MKTEITDAEHRRLKRIERLARAWVNADEIGDADDACERLMAELAKPVKRENNAVSDGAKSGGAE